jgi:hypothetical protein
VFGFIQQHQHNLQQPDAPSLAAAAAANVTRGDGSLHEPLLPRDQQHQSQQEEEQQQQQLTSEHQARGTFSRDNGNDSHVTLKQAMLLCIPTAFDLAATTLMNVGLLYVAASGAPGRWTDP